MYRIGYFSDWFDLAHGLRHPKGTYRIVAGTSPVGMPATVAPCRWYDMIEGARTTHVCWDRKHGLPLLIAPSTGAPQWRVMAIDTAPLSPATFVVDDKGYAHTDANADIERDGFIRSPRRGGRT
jgi:hypothetical protein